MNVDHRPPESPRTHLAIDCRLVGEPVDLGEGTSTVVLVTLPEMAADERGLVHGGFVFGLADYAAMLAVNHPDVVLGSAEARFLKPVSVGERLVAQARVEETDGRRSRVRVEVRRGEEAVMSGSFVCFTLAGHAFDAGGRG
ncbi:MAG TPA: hotdog domain-containing protein [Thermoanaerobaculia bacterium]